MEGRVTEYLVYPYKTENAEKINAYDVFLTDFNIQIVEPNRTITKNAARLRAKYPALKSMDAIHLATSIYYGCDVFLTNDSQLKQVAETNVLLVDEICL
ncbi:MAG: PIN domain-containing protein [Treponema sp.]|nr:PIN domain-containing protein [Treponema sp.]